jgi:23S rRNA (guanosine2251-2'-O)-methyltransferase
VRLVTGLQPVREAIRVHGDKLESVLVDETGGPQIDAVARFAEDRGAKVQRVRRAELDRASKGARHQGAIAFAPEFRIASIEELAEAVAAGGAGVGAGADAGAGAGGANAGAGTSTSTSAGPGARTSARAGVDAGADASASAGAGAGVDASAGAGADASAGARAGADASAGARAGVDARASAGAAVTTDARASIEEGVRAVAQPAVVVALDEIEDPQNFGAVIRSAVALGATAILWPEHHAAPLSPATFRASAGAVEHAMLCRVAQLPRALEQLHEAGARVIGLDHNSDRDLPALEGLDGAVVLVVGAEGKGLRKPVKRACTDLARLPMSGPIESLNASVAAGIALYEVMRRRPRSR